MHLNGTTAAFAFVYINHPYQPFFGGSIHNADLYKYQQIWEKLIAYGVKIKFTAQSSLTADPQILLLESMAKTSDDVNTQQGTAPGKRFFLSPYPAPKSACKGSVYFSMKNLMGRKINYDDKYESNYNNGTGTWSVPGYPGFVRFYLKNASSANNNVAVTFQVYITHYVKMYYRDDFDTNNDAEPLEAPVNCTFGNEES